MRFGLRVRHRRETELMISREAAAQRGGVSASWIASIENENKVPSQSRKIDGLAMALSLPRDELVQWINEEAATRKSSKSAAGDVARANKGKEPQVPSAESSQVLMKWFNGLNPENRQLLVKAANAGTLAAQAELLGDLVDNLKIAASAGPLQDADPDAGAFKSAQKRRAGKTIAESKEGGHQSGRSPGPAPKASGTKP